MIKTIGTLTQTTPRIEGHSSGLLYQNLKWQNEGKYTGKVIITYDVITKIRRTERWEWIDIDAAEAYKNFVISAFIDLYPDINVDIVVE